MDDRLEIFKKIKTLLRTHKKGLTITDIAQKLFINRNSVAKYLEILLMSGDVNLNTYGPAKVYTLSHRMPVSAMMKFSADVIILIDDDLHVLDVNENAAKVLGIMRDDLIGNRIDLLDSPFLDRLSIRDLMNGITKDGEMQREFSIVIDGADHYYRVRMVPTVFDQLMNGVTIIGEDITKQVRFEESLLISEARYRGIVEDQNEFICRFIPDGTLTFFNEAYGRYFGLSKETAIGQRHRVILLPADAMAVKGHLKSLTPERPVRTIEHRVLKPDGSIAWHFWSDRAMFDTSGNAIEYLSVGRDITKRKIAEEAVAESEKFYRTILDNMRDIYYRSDIDGTLRMVSRSGPKLLGYRSTDELIGRNISELFFRPDHDREEFLDRLAKDGEVTDFEVILKKKDGSPVLISTNSSVILDSAGVPVGIEGVSRDITTSRRSETVLTEEIRKLEMSAGLVRTRVSTDLESIGRCLEEAERLRDENSHAAWEQVTKALQALEKTKNML